MPRSMSRVRISSPAPFFFKGLREIANPLISPKIRSRRSQGATIPLRFSSTTQLGLVCPPMIEEIEAVKIAKIYTSPVVAFMSLPQGARFERGGISIRSVQSAQFFDFDTYDWSSELKMALYAGIAGCFSAFKRKERFDGQKKATGILIPAAFGKRVSWESF